MSTTKNFIVPQDPVTKGFQFEKAVEAKLNAFGLKAWRTNKANEADPKRYKAGFDGGVDIIATFSCNVHGYREYCFYIQCKCQESSLTKSAVSEAVGGMLARKAKAPSCVPVVISTSSASVETRQFANDLGVELFLKEEVGILENAVAGIPIEYTNSYGRLLRVLLYNITKDVLWIKTLPDIVHNIPERSAQEIMLQEAESDYQLAQSYLDKANEYERSASEYRQKSIDIQKATIFRVLQSYPRQSQRAVRHSHGTESIDLDSG